MHILLFILIFIIAIFVFGLSIIGFPVKNHFRDRPPFVRRSSSRPNQTESGRTATGQQSYGQNAQDMADNEEEIYSENVSGRRHKKIFTQDDGEYVDFEEIKE